MDSENNGKEKKIQEHKQSFGYVNIRNQVLMFSGEILTVLGIALAFLYFCYSIKDVIKPIVLIIILIASLVPFWKFLWAKAFIAVVLALSFVWIISTSGHLLMPFIIAGLLAYLVEPIVLKLSKRYSRLQSVLMVFIPFIIFAIVFIFFIFPRFIIELQRILINFPSYATNIALSIAEISKSFTDWINITIPINMGFNFIIQKEDIMNFLFGQSGILKIISNYVYGIKMEDISKGFSVVFSYFIIMPFVTFYFMLDFQKIRNHTLKLIPLRWQHATDALILESGHIINGYIRGMTILAISFIIITYALLLFAGSKYALVLAFTRGIFNYIPFIGPFAAFLLGLFVGMLTDQVWWQGAIKMGLVYAIVQIIDSGFMAPKILGRSVRIHPIFVMLATILGGILFGFVGMLIAVPTAAIVNAMLKVWLSKYYKSKFYTAKRKVGDL